MDKDIQQQCSLARSWDLYPNISFPFFKLREAHRVGCWWALGSVSPLGDFLDISLLLTDLSLNSPNFTIFSILSASS